MVEERQAHKTAIWKDMLDLLWAVDSPCIMPLVKQFINGSSTQMCSFSWETCPHLAVPEWKNQALEKQPMSFQASSANSKAIDVNTCQIQVVPVRNHDFLGMAQNDWYPKWDALTSRHRDFRTLHASVPWPRQTELLTCGDAEISGSRDLCLGWVQMPPHWPKNLPTQQSSWALTQPVFKKRFPPLLNARILTIMNKLTFLCRAEMCKLVQNHSWTNQGSFIMHLWQWTASARRHDIAFSSPTCRGEKCLSTWLCTSAVWSDIFSVWSVIWPSCVQKFLCKKKHRLSTVLKRQFSDTCWIWIWMSQVTSISTEGHLKATGPIGFSQGFRRRNKTHVIQRAAWRRTPSCCAP